jgi:hypothetical protein
MDAPKFSPAEGKLYDRLTKGRDVPIRDLYRVVTGRSPPKGMSNREQQRAIGSVISRLNEKLVGKKEHIKPGLVKQTYQLADLPRR